MTNEDYLPTAARFSNLQEKNTFFLHAKLLQSCLTVCRLLCELPFHPPGDLPHPGIEPHPLMSPMSAGRLFTTSATWETYLGINVQVTIPKKKNRIGSVGSHAYSLDQSQLPGRWSGVIG